MGYIWNFNQGWLKWKLCSLSHTTAWWGKTPTGHWATVYRDITWIIVKLSFGQVSCWKQYCLVLRFWPISDDPYLLECLPWVPLQYLGTPRISSTIQTGAQTGTSLAPVSVPPFGDGHHPTGIGSGPYDTKSSTNVQCGSPRPHGQASL